MNADLKTGKEFETDLLFYLSSICVHLRNLRIILLLLSTPRRGFLVEERGQYVAALIG